MKILITGGAGFIGSNILDLLLSKGHEIAIIDDLSSGLASHVNIPGILFVEGSICHGDILRGLVNSFRPDAICHQAAQPSLLRSVIDPVGDARVNILGTINVIEAARKVNAHIVMASTSAVYDENAPQPYTEGSKTRPTRPYGIAKKSAEYYLSESGISYSILRYGNVYGPRQVPVGENQLIPHALDHVYFGKPFAVNGDGEQSRDFVYVGDVARANMLALENRYNGVFNIAHGVPYSVNKVLQSIRESTGYTGEWKHSEPKPKEPKSVSMDSRLALQVMGWFPEEPLMIGIEKTVNWYKAHNEVSKPR